MPDRQAAAGIAFDDPVVVEQTNGTAGSACGDLDRDGRIEFITQEHFAIYDFDQGSMRTFRPLPDIEERLDRFGGDIEVGDIDGDGWPDIVLTDTSNSGDTGELIWFENPSHPGNPDAPEGPIPAVGLEGEWIEHSVSVWDGIDVGNQITHAEEEVGDVNNDGLLDIVVRDIRHGFWVHLQDPIGGWHPRVFVATNPREGLDLWDPDGDGDLDILLNGVWFETPDDPLTGTYVLRPVIGMGSWYPAGNSPTEINDYACKVIARDFNNDGRDDILISNAEELDGQSPSKPKGISVFLQPGNMIDDQWTETVVEPLNFSWHTLQSNDMNNDGFPDIVGAVSLVGSDTAEAESNIWINDGTANFTKTPIADDYGYQGEVGDSDGDGDQDLFLPENFSSGKVRLYENISAVQPATDFTLYMDSFGVSGPDAAQGVDFDGDSLANIIEFVLGTDPTTPTPPSERPRLSELPNGATFTFRRTGDSIPYDPRIEFSTDMKSFFPVENGVEGVAISVVADGFGSGIDRVEVFLPDSLASEGRLFARLGAYPIPVLISGINYSSYMDGFGLAGDASSLTTDFDYDGLANHLEFVLGTDPTVATPPSDKPVYTSVAEGYLVTFRRSDLSIPARPTVEYSSDMVDFKPATNGVDGVTVTVTDEGIAPGIDRVEVFLPESLMKNGLLFARFAVSIDL